MPSASSAFPRPAPRRQPIGLLLSLFPRLPFLAAGHPEPDGFKHALDDPVETGLEIFCHACQVVQPVFSDAADEILCMFLYDV